MADFDKLLANLRLGTADLSSDVDKAVIQIEKLNKKAEEIDGAFAGSSGTSGGNLKKMTAELLEVSKNMTKVSKDIAEKYEATAKRVKTAQVSIMESIKHNVETGKQSYEEAYNSAKKYHEMVSKQYSTEMASNKGKAMNASKYGKDISAYNPYDTDATQRELMNVEKYMAQLSSKVSKAKQDLAKQAREALSKDVVNQKETVYASDLAGYKSYLEEKLGSDKFNGEERILLEKQLAETKRSIQKESESEERANAKRVQEEQKALNKQIEADKKASSKAIKEEEKALQKEIEAEKKASSNRTKEEEKAHEKAVIAEKREAKNKKIALDKEYKIESNAELKKAIALGQTLYKGNYQEFKEYCEKLLNTDKLTTEQQIQLRNKLSQVEKADAKIREKDLKDKIKLEKQSINQTNQSLRNLQPAVDKNSPVQKFDNITNYAFDATLIYGAVNAVKRLSEEMVSLESNMVNLQRVAPNLSDFQVDEITDGLMNIAGETNNTVGNVQDIANYWVRVNDEIAKSEGLLSYLTDVTSMAMNVGGFDNAEEAVQLLSASINQMGLEWSDAGAILDGWIKIADETAVGSAKDLAEMVLRTGTQAKMLGVDINQLNAIMGIFANNMAKTGEEAGTAMKTMFSYFTDPKAIETLYSHGVMVMKNADEYRDFADVMVDLQMKYKELERDGNDVAIREMNNALGRTRRVDYVGTLINNFDQFDSLVARSTDSIGYAGLQNEKMMETLEAQLNRLKVTFTQLAKGLADSGMLDDFKFFIEQAVNGMNAINSMDEVTKRFLLTIVELTVAFTILQKANKLLWGADMTHLIANLTAKTALMFNSQMLLNIAKKSGAGIEVISATAITAETISTVANTTAKGVNNAEAVKSIWISEAEVVQSAKTVTANVAETASEVTLANAKMIANTNTGLLTSSIAGMLNPIGLLIGALAIATAGIFAYKMNAKKATEETLRWAEAKEDLAGVVANSKDPTFVVDEFESGQLQKTISELDQAKIGYDEAIKKVSELKAKQAELIAQNNTDNGTYRDAVGSWSGMMPTEDVVELSNELSEAQGAVDDYNRQLLEMGTTASTVTDDVSALEEIVARSGNTEFVSAMQVLEKIKSLQKENEETRILIDRYVTLSNMTSLTSDQTAEFQRVVAVLSGTFPNLSISTKDSSNAIRDNAVAMRDGIGITGQLTNAQQNQVFAMANVSASARTMAINLLNGQIDATTNTIKQIKLRLLAYQAEANAMNSLARQASRQNVRTSSGNLLVSDGAQFSPTNQKKMENLRTDTSALKDAERLLNNLMGQLNTYNKITATKAVDSASKSPYKPESVKKASAKTAEDAKKKAEKDAKEAQRIAEEALRVAERLMQERERAVMDMQSKIVNALKAKYKEDTDNRLKALKVMEKAEVDVYDARIKKLRKEIEALQDTRKDERDNIDSLKKNLTMWKRDESEYGKRKTRELEKQLAEEEKNLLIKNKELEIDSIEEKKQKVIDLYEAKRDMDSKSYDAQLKAIDNASKEVNLYKQANELINGNVTAQQKILGLLKEYVPEYASIGQVMGKSMADSMMTEVKEAMRAVQGLKGTGTTETPAGYKAPVATAPKAVATTPKPTTTTPKPVVTPKPATPKPVVATPKPVVATPPSSSSPPIKKGYSSKGEKLSPTTSFIDYMKSKGYYSTFNDRKAIYDYYAGKNVLPKGTYEGSGTQNSAMWTRLKKDGFKTGGYTGEWGSNGKMAMLHEKERVLNSQQTKAFENLVYNFLPKLNVGKSIDNIGKTASTIINNNAPLIQNDIKITNNTPFDVSNKMDNLNRAIKAELHQIGYNRSVGGRR